LNSGYNIFDAQTTGDLIHKRNITPYNYLSHLRNGNSSSFELT